MPVSNRFQGIAMNDLFYLFVYKYNVFWGFLLVDIKFYNLARRKVHIFCLNLQKKILKSPFFKSTFFV